MAFAGGLLAGLAGLAEAPGAYQSARRKSQEIEGGDISLNDARMSALGKAALGSVVGQGEQIAGLGGGPSSLSLAVPGRVPPQPQGGGPQGAPGMPPGMPSQPMQSPGGPPPQGAGPPGGMPPQAVPQPMQGGPPPGMVNPRQMGGQAQNLTGPPIQPGGMAPQPRPPMPPGPPGGSPSGAPQQSGAGPPGGGAMSQGGGPLNLNQLAQMIRQQNPNLPPQAMFEALKSGSQLLTPMANMELKNLALELRMQDMQRKFEQFAIGDQTKRDVATQRTDTQRDIAADAQEAAAGRAGARAAEGQKKTEKAEDETSEIVKAIVSGRQPPVTTGLYGKGPAVKAGLEKAGFDMGKAQLEWQGAQRQVASLNGPQMTRFNVLASTVDNTIDHVKDLAEQMKLKNIPLLNQIELQAYIQAQGDTPNSKLAVQYMTAVNGLKEEFANLANGGYAPTAPAWKLANEQINGNYSVGKLSASLEEVQRLIRYRMQALQNRTGAGGNRYESSGEQQGGGSQPATAPATGGFDRAGAKAAGYSDEEIDAYIKGGGK